MTKTTIETTFDWSLTFRRKGRITLTEYKNGKELKPKYVKG